MIEAIIGDDVIVSVGSDANELSGVVEDIDFFQPEDVPLPLERTKQISRKANRNGDNETDSEDGEPQFLALNAPLGIDVLDESLYSYDSTVFSLTPAIRKKLQRAYSGESRNLPILYLLS